MINAADEVYRNAIKACDAQMTADQNAEWPQDNEVAMVVALVPVPVAWGFAYSLLFLVRWIRRGFDA